MLMRQTEKLELYFLDDDDDDDAAMPMRSGTKSVCAFVVKEFHHDETKRKLVTLLVSASPRNYAGSSSPSPGPVERGVVAAVVAVVVVASLGTATESHCDLRADRRNCQCRQADEAV